MEDAVILHELSQLDYTKVAALQQKRTLAFINHFMLTTVQFLNNFARRCETKLQKFERKMQKVEASLVIVETKLSSVPELETVMGNPHPTSETVMGNPHPQSETRVPDDANIEEIAQLENHEQVIQSMDHEPDMNAEYDRFLKMVQVGVPLDAVKLKVKLEGLDPDYLEKCLQK